MKVFAESESKLTYEAPNLVELGSVTELTNYTVSVTAQ